MDVISETANEWKRYKEHKQKQTKFIIVSLLLLALLLGAGVWYLNHTPAGGNGGLIFFDESAQTGNLPGKSMEQIQEELNRIVEEGMFNISIASEVYFDSWDRDGAVRIENIKANPYHMKVAITLDETSETIYESGAIKPEQYIDKIKLTKTHWIRKRWRRSVLPPQRLPLLLKTRFYYRRFYS